MAWTPPERPPWVERLIAHGPAVGDAAHLVSLDPADMLAAATASTGGLDDFADAWDPDWRRWYELLVRSLDTESNLHALGRLLVRQEEVGADARRLDRVEQEWF